MFLAHNRNDETADCGKSASHARRLLPARIEWPTVGLAVTIYLAFGLLTWFDAALPWWLVLPLGAYLVAWHGSLQHEVTHGHPTSWHRLNEAIVLPSLWLWLPFRVYRDTHLVHHCDERLTDPLEDPESYYHTLGEWLGYNRIIRVLLWFTNTVAGRLVLGPLVAVCGLIADQLPRLWRGDPRCRGDWVMHGLGCLLVLVWVVGVCDISIGYYLLLYAYPGTALSMLRSFCEHKASSGVDSRTVIVEAEPPLGLLFLYNNLHLLHHKEPGLPWYRLPGRYRETKEALLRSNDNYCFSGYLEIMARYLLWPKESPLHPLEPWRRQRETESSHP